MEKQKKINEGNIKDEFLYKSTLIKMYEKLLKQGFNTSNWQLYIKDAGVNKNNISKGRGVFTNTPILKRGIIELCPIMTLIKRKDFANYKDYPNMCRYIFWDNDSNGDSNNDLGLWLAGYAHLINSPDTEDEANAVHLIFIDQKFSAFIATKDIKADEEITCWFGKGFYERIEWEGKQSTLQ